MITVFACLMIADFITGLIHWIEDAYGLPSWPVLGKLVIEPNIEHHLEPAKLADSPVWLRNYQGAVPAAVAAAIAIAVDYWPLALVCLFAAFGNEVHAWAHAGKKRPWWVRLLHDAAIVQTPEHHARHHRRPYACRFCTLTNLLNPVLDLVRFWAAMEWLLMCVGIKTQRLSAERLGT